MSAHGLHASLQVTARGVGVDFDIAPGQTVALVGPNGAGKSTILAVLAGLLRPDTGRGVLRGPTGQETVLYDMPGTWRAPHRRGVVQLAQDPLLFPHLSALDNIAYGPRAAGTPRTQATGRARDWLDRVGLAELSDRRPDQLSGGQAQRVAIARALAAEPAMLLLDEPMAALDATATPQLQVLLRQVLAQRTTLLVTHDMVDALALADRIVVLEEGRIVQDGLPREVLAAPRSRFAAELAGKTVIAGTFRDGALDTELGLIHGQLGAGEPGPDTDPAPPPEGTPGVALITPLDVAIHPEDPGGSPRNAWPVTLTAVEPHGPLVRARAGGLAADVTPAAAAELGVRPGDRVFFVAKAAAIRLLPTRG